MIEINTIQQFLSLSLVQQQEIQKALKTKERLEHFLISMNRRSRAPKAEKGQWVQCGKCVSTGQPGWVWWEERDDSDVHPSQIHKCLKFLWYSCNGQAHQMEEYIEPRLRMIFDIGSAWHAVIQGYGRKGAWCEPQFYRDEAVIDPDTVTHDGTPVLPLAHHFWIRGHVDAVIERYFVPNVPGLGDVMIRIVHEYKTINANGFSKLTRPKPEHKQQATIYSAVFDVPIVVYVYTNKDDCKLIDFPVPFDPVLWNEIVQRIQKVQYYVNTEQPPPWEETSASSNPRECMECGFRKICEPPLAQIRKG